MSKEEIVIRAENNTLPPHLREVLEEAKSWWHHNSTEVLKDNMRIYKENTQMLKAGERDPIQ